MAVNLKKLFKYLAASVFAALIFVCFSGFTLTGSAKIRYSGKGTAAFSVISDAAEQEFRQAAQDYVDGFTVRSGESDMITLEDVTKTENGYNVEVSFRRLDKVKAMGEFFLQKTSSFVPETSETGEMIRNWEAGMFAVTETIYYKSVAKSVDIDVTTVADGLRLYTAGGKEIAVDELDAYAAGAGDKSTAAAFCLLDVGCVESVTVSFPADIAYYAGGDMRLVNKNTVEMRPVFIEAEITSTEGNMIPETKDVGTIFGYVIYEKGLSPAAICGIVAACVILGGLLAAFFVYLVKLGRNIAPFAANGARGNVPCGNACGGAAVSLTLATEISAASAAQAEMRTVRGVKEQSVLTRGWKKFLKGDLCTGIRQHKLLYLLLLPAFLYVLIFCYLPMFGLVIAFQDYKILDGVFGSEFIGMKTFRKIFYAQIRGSYRMFRNTIYISLIRIGTNFPLILVFTLLLNEVKNRRAKGVIQTISYIPNFISWIAVGGMAFNLLGEKRHAERNIRKNAGAQFRFLRRTGLLVVDSGGFVAMEGHGLGHADLYVRARQYQRRAVRRLHDRRRRQIPSGVYRNDSGRNERDDVAADSGYFVDYGRQLRTDHRHDAQPRYTIPHHKRGRYACLQFGTGRRRIFYRYGVRTDTGRHRVDSGDLHQPDRKENR